MSNLLSEFSKPSIIDIKFLSFDSKKNCNYYISKNEIGSILSGSFINGNYKNKEDYKEYNVNQYIQELKQFFSNENGLNKNLLSLAIKELKNAIEIINKLLQNWVFITISLLLVCQHEENNFKFKLSIIDFSDYKENCDKEKAKIIKSDINKGLDNLLKIFESII